MILGQSAVTAAVMALDRQQDPQDLPYDLLRARLLSDGQVLEFQSPASTNAHWDKSKLQGLSLTMTKRSCMAIGAKAPPQATSLDQATSTMETRAHKNVRPALWHRFPSLVAMKCDSPTRPIAIALPKSTLKSHMQTERRRPSSTKR